MFRFGVDSFTTSGGTTAYPPRHGITVVVGPNNAGKSRLLFELREKLSTHESERPAGTHFVAPTILFGKEGSVDEAYEWAVTNGKLMPGGQVNRAGITVDGDHLRDTWPIPNDGRGIGKFAT